VEDLIARKVSAIFLAPREAEGFSSTFQAAKAANIPIILIDREATGTPGVDFVTVIKSDFIKEGQRAGEWLAKQTNGKAGIVELKAQPAPRWQTTAAKVLWTKSAKART
jgi:ribose transport system substrate-binding protein